MQAKTGELIGSKNQQAKGVVKETEGKSQQGLGDLKDALKNTGRKT